MSIANEITRLTNAKTGIKTALEGKGVTVPADAKIDTYGNLVEGIEVGVDTSDADAVAGDIVKGKTAYINGTKVVGTMKEEISLNNGYDEIIVNNEDNRVYFKDTFNSSTEKHYINPNTEIMISAPFDVLDSELGITANKILSGNTIIGVEGTATSDANATANDIADGKTAYIKGQKVTGILPYNSQSVQVNGIGTSTTALSDKVQLITKIPTKGIYEQYTKIACSVDNDYLAGLIGLTANKVKSGETILGIQGNVQEGTTADKTIQAEDAELETIQEITGNNDIGLSIISNPLTQSKLFEQGSMIEMHPTFEQLATTLGITGDKVKAGEVICGVDGTVVEGVDTSDATAIPLDIEEGKTAYVNGQKVTGTLPAVGSINFRGNNFTVSQMSTKIKIKTNYVPTSADTEKFIINTTSNVYMEVPQEILAQSLGLTPDKIKSGVTICGVTGTYAGESTPTE